MNTTSPDILQIPSASSHSAVPWGWRDMLVAILITALGILGLNALVLGASVLLHIPLRENKDVLVVFLIGQDLIVVASAWLFSVVRYRVGWDLLGLRPFAVPIGCMMSGGLLILSYVIRVVYGLIVMALGARLAQQDVLTRLDMQGVGFVLTLVAAAVIAPISEEVFFRGFLYSGLRGRIGVTGAMVVSTLFFTALHLSVELFIPILVLGFFLAWLYEHTGSLYPGIFLHAANNALSLILFFLLQNAGLMPAGLANWLHF